MAKNFVKIKTKKGYHFRASVYVGLTDGKKKMIYQTFDTERDAKEWIAKRTVEKNEGTLDTGKHTMGELFDDLLRDFRINGKSEWAPLIVEVHLRPYFGELNTKKVTFSVIQDYIEKRKALGRANGTINRELTLVRRALNFAKNDTGKVKHEVPKITRLKEADPRKGFFELDQYDAMLAQLDGELKPVLVIGYHTGFRRGEMLSLKWSQVDLIQETIRLDPGTTKNDEGRLVYMTREVLEVLQKQRAIRDRYQPSCEWVLFRHATGEPLKDFRTAWEGACKRAGLWDASAGKIGKKTKKPVGRATRLVHDLRRTAVSNLVQSGTPEKVAMEISGHRTRSVFDRYHIVPPSELKKAARRSDEYQKEIRQLGCTKVVPFSEEQPGKVPSKPN